MKTRSQSRLAAAEADATLEPPFRFLDLPKEIRFMVYEGLMDNKKNDVKFTAPRDLEIDLVYLDGMYYPSILQVSKQVQDEYWSLCLRNSILWIHYTSHRFAPSDEEINEEEAFTIPFLSEWLRLPIKVLVRVREVIFKFQADWILPDLNPFSGVASCTSELLSLRFIAIWSDVNMSAVECGRAQAEQDERFHNFVESLFDEELALLDVLEEEYYRKFGVRVDCDMHTPLYEMNKNYCWPRRRHLQQGVAALAGLPEWGYSMYRLHAPWDRPLEDSFTYHGEELTFLRVEHELPVLGREDTECDSPSEWDYEFDENGWATGNIPDWS